MTDSTPPDSRISAESFASRCEGRMIPAAATISYFSVIPLEDEDLRRLVYDPAAALPPKIARIVPHLGLVVVGYLERPESRDKDSASTVAFRPPAPSRRLESSVVERNGAAYVFLAVKDEDVADYHDAFYRELARLIAERAPADLIGGFADIVREELDSEARGELDDAGWRLKEQVLKRQNDVSRETKLLKNYRTQAFQDTLALYLHGLCCDIDVEAGPRQLAGRLVRRRLNYFREALPPPAGVPLFPEELDPSLPA